MAWFYIIYTYFKVKYTIGLCFNTTKKKKKKKNISIVWHFHNLDYKCLKMASKRGAWQFVSSSVGMQLFFTLNCAIILNSANYK